MSSQSSRDAQLGCGLLTLLFIVIVLIAMVLGVIWLARAALG